jgi:hypothetical protein
MFPQRRIKMAKKKAKKKKKFTDEDVFEIFGVGKGDKALRAFISGQRKINGRLYKAIDLILDGLPRSKGKMSSADDRKRSSCLDRAWALNEVIPGKVPPFCNDDGLG